MPQSNASSLWWLVLTAISSSSVAIGAVAWLIRRLLGQWLDKEMQEHTSALEKDTERFKVELGKEAEQFRQRLQHEKDLEIEKLRAELGRVTMEHQVRFNQLHTKRFAVIVRLYKLITHTQRTMADYFAPFVPAGSPPEAERGKIAAEAWRKLNIFFRDYEIFFDKETCRVMNQYLNELRKLHIDFQNKQYAQSHVAHWNGIWDTLNKEVIELKRALADSFRKKIGVESE